MAAFIILLFNSLLMLINLSLYFCLPVKELNTVENAIYKRVYSTQANTIFLYMFKI